MMRVAVVALTFGIHILAAPSLASEVKAIVHTDVSHAGMYLPCPTDTEGDSNLTAEGFQEGVEVGLSESTSGSTDCVGDSGADSDPYEYRRLEKMCGPAGSNFCTAVYCGADEVGYYVQRRLAGSNDPWQASGTDCVGPDGPSVTPVLVSQALRRIGLPDAKLQTQPGFDSGKTLVNFDTNFYTTAGPVTRTFTLLGERVTVRATPSSYTWHFDSGLPDDTRTTSTPGDRYPDLEVTYAYIDAHVTVHPSVDVTYSAQFSVNGGTWQTIPDTVTIEGEPISRYVAEAQAMLTEMK